MPPRIDYSQQRVLVVDSSGNLRSIIQSMLFDIGFKQVKAITTSERALDLIEHESFDIILLGHNSNDRYSGLRLLEEARHRELIKPRCSWVLMTGDLSQELVLYAIEIEPDEVLVKPFSLEALSSRLHKICVRHQALADIERAIEHKALNRAIKLCEDFADRSSPYYQYVQKLKGKLLIENGQYLEAEKVFEHCDWKGQDWRGGILLATCRFYLGNFSAAEEQLRYLIDAHPLLIPAYDLLAKIHEARNQLDQASDVLMSATRQSPLAIPRQMELGRVASRAKKLDLAEASFKKSVSLGENSPLATPDAYLKLANVRRLQSASLETNIERQKSMTSIENLVKRAQRRFPDRPEIAVQGQLLMSQAYEDLADTARAQLCLADAELLAKTAELTLDLREVKKNLLQDAIPDLPKEQQAQGAAPKVAGNQPRAVDPVMSEKVNRTGVRNYMAGNSGQAIRHFSLAFEHNKQNASALLNLAQLYLEAARDARGRREERMTMFKRYLHLAERLELSKSQQSKYETLSAFGARVLDELPEGSLGALLK